MTSQPLSRRIWAVVPAAGTGSRMALDIPKQYVELNGKTIIEHSLSRLLAHPKIEGVVVAIAADDQWWQGLSLESSLGKPVIVVNGGQERCHSVLHGINRLQQDIAADDWVMVHDAARPCIRQSDLDKLINELADHAVGGILATRVRDTMKRSNNSNGVTETVDRSNLWHALTPQMFRLGVLKSAIETALTNGIMVTDEASAIESQGLSPLLIEAHQDNIKVTRMEDLSLASYYMQAQSAQKEL